MITDIQTLIESGKVTTAAALNPQGITRNYKPIRYNLNGFDADCHPEVHAMHREAQWLVNDVLNKVRPRRWLSLLGASGVGKTHLALACRDVIRQARPSWLVQGWKWPRVCSILRAGDWGFAEYLIHDVDVLVLDDVGAENTTPAILSALNRIADGRLNKWTIWTSNLTADDINTQLDARIASRLYRGNNVVCTAVDAPDYCHAKRHA